MLYLNCVAEVGVSFSVRCYILYQYFNIQDPSPDISNVPNVPQFNNGEEKIVLVLLFQTAAWIKEFVKIRNTANYRKM